MTDNKTDQDGPAPSPNNDGDLVNTPDGTPLQGATVDPATGAPGVDSTAQERMEHGDPTGDRVGPAAAAGAFVQTSPMYTGSPYEADPDRHNRMRDIVGDTVPEGLVAQVYGALQELDTAESRADDEGRRSAMKRAYAAGMGDPEIAAARRRLAAQNDEQHRDEEPRERRAPGSTPQTVAPTKTAPAKKAAPAKTTTAKNAK